MKIVRAVNMRALLSDVFFRAREDEGAMDGFRAVQKLLMMDDRG